MGIMNCEANFICMKPYNDGFFTFHDFCVIHWPRSDFEENSSYSQYFIFIWFTEFDSDTWQKIFDTNAKGSWLCLKEALQSMKDLTIVGHIINMNRLVVKSTCNTSLSRLR